MSSVPTTSTTPATTTVSTPVKRSSSRSGSAHRAPLSPITTSALASSSPAVNLAVPRGLGPALRHAWVVGDPDGLGLAATDVRATATGSVFYAGQPSIHTDWAISRFVPTSLAESRAGTRSGRALLDQFDLAVAFVKASKSSWAYLGEATDPCSLTVPRPVLSAWGLCTAVGS